MLFVKNTNRPLIASVLSISVLMTTTSVLLPAHASIKSSNGQADESSSYTPPTGTLLLPLTPKLDPINTKSQTSNNSSKTNSRQLYEGETAAIVETAAEKGAD